MDWFATPSSQFRWAPDSFAGWLAAPTALIWSFSQGRGHLTITTLRLAPGSGPAATVLLEALIEYVATIEPS
jgi:hypothetical protein